jgi:hypothetical protein
MVIGITLMKLGGTPYYSPQFPRGGNAAVFAAEVLNLSTGAGLDIIVQHKNSDETSWTTAGTFASIGAADVETLEVTGLKEEIRFRYSVTGNDEYDAVHFNMLAPAWRP